jgi:hypothetical protein
MRRLIRFNAGIAALVLGFGTIALASPLIPDWSKTATIDPYGRANPYGWDAQTLKEKTRLGLVSALNYPVETTGILLPPKPFLKFLDAKPGEPLFDLMKSVLSLNSDFVDFKGIWDWMGLSAYPDTDTEIPYPFGTKPDYPMGISFLRRGQETGFTFSCAVCHTSELFGKPVIGLSNRFEQANLIFVYGQKFLHDVSPSELALFTNATPGETGLYAEARDHITSVGTKRPATLGLDTALSQVVLSLAKRRDSPWAERDPAAEANPRPTLLQTETADSKPSVWWNAKYKTRWLSDGAVVSGSPILTNIIWNELGRGGDLKELYTWMNENPEVLENLTTAVFATQAPKWADFIPKGTLNLVSAKRGETLFLQNCAYCHGTYEKAWSLSASEFLQRKNKNKSLTIADTLRVKYFSQTRVVDVGTDSSRRIGMNEIARFLNPLAISEQLGIVNVSQSGYVPPPLEGIFARYPYLHNNSIPNLCALMTNPANRPVTYTSGKAINPETDFDQACVGYPTGAKTPSAWLTDRDASLHLYDTRMPGLSNSGHYDGIFKNNDGSERYSRSQKSDLIEFLKTL